MAQAHAARHPRPRPEGSPVMTDDRRSGPGSTRAGSIATPDRGFHITAAALGPARTVVITNPETRLCVVIAHRGATLLNWHTMIAGRPADVVDGYTTAAELLRQDGVRNGVMAPFTNRIAHGRYRFNDTEHQLSPHRQRPQQPPYHGFVRGLDMILRRASATAEHARLSFTTKAIRPGVFGGYPFAVDVHVCYLITRTGVHVEVTGHNAGDVPAPFAAGWHPYFRLGDAGIEGLELAVPASAVIQTGPSLIPYPGAAAYQPLNAGSILDFRRPRPIGTAVLDTCFAGLSPGPDGRCRTVLRDPATGHGLAVWQQRGLMHVFTGDTLTRDPRRAVALEPVEVMTDAFNREEAITDISLAPGQSRTFRFGAEMLAPGQSPAELTPRRDERGS
jgi:aldose 1-epimerase